MSNIYGIYDLANKEQCVTVGTIDEISKFLKLPIRAFNKCMREGKYTERFEIVYLYNEEQETLKNKIAKKYMLKI